MGRDSATTQQLNLSQLKDQASQPQPGYTLIAAPSPSVTSLHLNKELRDNRSGTAISSGITSSNNYYINTDTSYNSSINKNDINNGSSQKQHPKTTSLSTVPNLPLTGGTNSSNALLATPQTPIPVTAPSSINCAIVSTAGVSLIIGPSNLRVSPIPHAALPVIPPHPTAYPASRPTSIATAANNDVISNLILTNSNDRSLTNYFNQQQQPYQQNNKQQQTQVLLENENILGNSVNASSVNKKVINDNRHQQPQLHASNLSNLVSPLNLFSTRDV